MATTQLDNLEELRTKFLDKVVSATESTTDLENKPQYTHEQASKVLEDFLGFCEDETVAAGNDNNGGSSEEAA